jgi:6-phosphogluconolactonase
LVVARTVAEPESKPSEESTEMPADRLYAQTNSPDENEVIVFRSQPEGTLLPAGRYRTDGFGTGVDIGAEGAVDSQGSVALSDDGRFLFAVNAGSNDISSFAVANGGLRLVGKASSRGPGPVSLALRGDLLYVANKFGRGGIAGFRMDPDGELRPLQGSARPLSAEGAAPAQLSFTPDGRFLVLTELATDRIVTYRIDGNGRPGAPRSTPSSGLTPFGFAFDVEGRLVVSEAFRNEPDASALSSYRITSTGSVVAISASVPTTETSACWVATTPDGQYTYTSNSLSGSISGYRIEPDGTLELLDSDGRTGVTGEGSHPIDMAISGDGSYLYVLNGGSQTVGVFEVQLGGGLKQLPYVGGVPTGSVGLVAA